MTPKASVTAESARRGETEVATSCVDVLRGGVLSIEFAEVLAGPAGRAAILGLPGWREYWLRVWALRGLLYAWTPEARCAVAVCLNDASWRVREMALRVVGRRELDDCLDVVLRLRHDPVARVRATAERTLMILTTAG